MVYCGISLNGCQCHKHCQRSPRGLLGEVSLMRLPGVYQFLYLCYLYNSILSGFKLTHHISQKIRKLMNLSVQKPRNSNITWERTDTGHSVPQPGMKNSHLVQMKKLLAFGLLIVACGEQKDSKLNEEAGRSAREITWWEQKFCRVWHHKSGLLSFKCSRVGKETLDI